MKILHSPVPIANQPWLLSMAQRKLGEQSDVMVFRSAPYENFTYDYNFHLEKYDNGMKSLVAFFKASLFVPKVLMYYDVFHFHTKSILPNGLDAKVARQLGKKIVFQIHGCEVRLSDNHGFCKTCKSYGKKYKEKMIQLVNQVGHLVIVVTPDLLDELPNATWIPDSIDLENWKSEDRHKTDEKIRIVHIPSDPEVKGTAFIENAVKNLKKEYDIELILLRNVKNAQVKEFSKQADISVDQLLIGSYGVNAIETMSLGVPTCAYIRTDLVDKYPKDCPIFNTSKENIEDRLRILVEDEKLRRKLSKDSVKFVQENHDYMKNADRLLQLYSEIG